MLVGGRAVYRGSLCCPISFVYRLPHGYNLLSATASPTAQTATNAALIERRPAYNTAQPVPLPGLASVLPSSWVVNDHRLTLINRIQ